MMQLIRDKAQGIVAWIIVAIIVIVFVLGAVNFAFFSPSNKIVAKVRGEKITEQDVELIYNNWLRFSSTQKNFDITKINPTQIKQQITRGLAERKALVLMLNKKGFGVSKQMIIDSIRTNPDMQQDGKFSPERYKSILAQLNIDEATFEQLQRDDLMVNQLQTGIVASDFVLEADIKRAFALKDQKRSFAYQIIPYSRFLNAKVSDAEVSEYYNQHLNDYVQPEKIKLEYLQLSIDDLLKNAQIADKEIRDYYDQNIDQFSDPELLRVRHIMLGKQDKAKLEQIYTQLKNGADFVTLAKKESIDKETASKGGDLGWISKNDGLPQDIFNLKKVNEYTQVVETDYGWHIFQLVQRKGGNVKSFEEVKKFILPRLKREKAEQLFSAKGEELANLTFENPQTLQVASEKLQLPIKSTEFFDPSGAKSGIASLPNVVTVAFSEEVNRQKNNSSLIRINDDNYLVIRVAAKQEQRQFSLDEVRSKIVKLLQEKAAKSQAKKYGTELLSSLKKSKDLKGEWKKVVNAARDNTSVKPEILLSVFTMPQPKQSAEPTIAGFSMLNGDYVIVSLSKVTDGVMPSKDSTLRENLTKQLAIMNGKQEYFALQEHLINEAKIDYTGAK